MKREGRPSEASILNSRMIDRPIRPMFPKNTRTDTQIISTIMSSSGLSDFGWYGVTGASLSVMLAGVKEFEGPVAAVRIASDESGNFIFDPTFDQIASAHLDLTVAGTLDAITMVESQGSEVSNDLMVKAFEYAHSIIKDLCKAQYDFISAYTQVYALPTIELTIVDTDPEVLTKVHALVTEDEIQALYGLGKLEFHDVLHDLVEVVAEKLGYDEETNTPKKGDIADSVKDVVKTHMRKTVIETRSRLDGRRPDEVRPVRATAPILPRTH